MATFDAKGWWRVQGWPNLAEKFHSFEKIVSATEDELCLPWESQRVLRAADILKSQGKEEASRILAKDLLVSIYPELDADQV